MRVVGNLVGAGIAAGAERDPDLGVGGNGPDARRRPRVVRQRPHPGAVQPHLVGRVAADRQVGDDQQGVVVAGDRPGPLPWPRISTRQGRSVSTHTVASV